MWSLFQYHRISWTTPPARIWRCGRGATWRCDAPRPAPRSRRSRGVAKSEAPSPRRTRTKVRCVGFGRKIDYSISLRVNFYALISFTMLILVILIFRYPLWGFYAHISFVILDKIWTLWKYFSRYKYFVKRNYKKKNMEMHFCIMVRLGSILTVSFRKKLSFILYHNFKSFILCLRNNINYEGQFRIIKLAR